MTRVKSQPNLHSENWNDFSSRNPATSGTNIHPVISSRDSSGVGLQGSLRNIAETDLDAQRERGHARGSGERLRSVEDIEEEIEVTTRPKMSAKSALLETPRSSQKSYNSEKRPAVSADFSAHFGYLEALNTGSNYFRAQLLVLPKLLVS